MLSKTTAMLGAALCASVGEYAAASTVSAVYPYAPVVFWSDRATFNAKNAYVGAVLDEKDTVSVLNSVLARDAKQDVHNVLSQSSTSSSRAEALCVFVRESLRSTDLADFDEKSFVQSAVEDSVSSVVIPHTTRSQSLVSALKASSPVVLSIDHIQAWIASADGKKLLSNDQADLVLINVPENYTLAAADAKIQAAAKALVGATNGLVDFALTGDDAAPVVAKKDPYARRRLATGTTSVSTTDIICDAGYIVGMSSTGKAFCFSHYVRMTPEVLTALLFGFFFIFISYVGLSVLNAIQTPLRYPLHGPPKGKEF